MTMAAEGATTGPRVALAESRQLDEFAELLREVGCTPLRYPLVDILDPEDWADVDRWLDLLRSGRFDDVLFYTGEGLRRLRSRALERGQDAEFIAALTRCRRIIRGPKPAKVLKEFGLSADLSARPATTDGLIAVLRDEPLAGRNLGLQLYPNPRSQALMEFLDEQSVRVYPVTPYRYAPDSDGDRVAELIGRAAEGGIDVLAFTSAAQVDRLWQVAETRALLPQLATALTRAIVAAVGPVTGDALRQRGVDPAIEPKSSFFMRPLARAIADRCAE